MIKIILILLSTFWICTIFVGCAQKKRVAGRSGKQCYITENKPGTIKNPVYFGTIEDCKEFTKSNKNETKKPNTEMTGGI